MELKELRYNIMLALYFPILLYAFSTFDLNENTYAIESINPVVVGDQTVVLGQPYTAQAFLAVGTGQGQQLEGEGDLIVEGDSLFRMDTASLLAQDENEKEISYTGQFSLSQLGGAVSQLPVTGTFRVRRPEIVATSEATQTLYRQCLNTIRFEVPGLEDRTLRLTSGGPGTGILGRSLSLSPGGDGATVNVYLVDDDSSDVFLGSKSFAVMDPPRPEIRVSNAGREVRNGDNLPTRRALLEFNLSADPEFAKRYPRDARYSVARATVYLRKGLAASQTIGTFNLEGGQRLVLTRALRDAQPGDRVMIRLEGIVRINHAGQAVSVPFSEASRTFGFVLS